MASNKTILVEGNVIPIYLVYQFINKLIVPFNKTKAYQLGIIDEDGQVLRKRNTLTTSEEKNAYTIFDTLVFNIKKILESIPGGKSRLVSFAAAMFLLKEQNNQYTQKELTIKFNSFLKEFIDSVNLPEILPILEEGEPTGPTNSVGNDAIDLYPGLLFKKKLKRYVDINEYFGKFYDSHRSN
jgi:hypothetical protein